MSTVLNQTIGAILDSYADVIEGGSTYRGSGSSFRGVPGVYSVDEGLRLGVDTPLTVVGGASCTTTTFNVASTYSWTSSRWVKADSPAFWAFCTTDAGLSNLHQARKITGWNNTTKVFTVDPAFTAAPTANDVMTIKQGFKRLPNHLDIEDKSTESPDGWDRYFQLMADDGKQLPWFGAGVRTYETTMTLRLRIVKHARERDAIASAMENMSILRVALSLGANPDHRDGTYTRALISEAAPTMVKDQLKIVITQPFRLIYRISSDLL